MQSDIVERLRKWDAFWEDDLLVAAAEIERLRAELVAMRQQRDEARRDACAFEAIVRWNEAHPKGIMSPCAVERISREIAVDCGWDCFKEAN